MSEKPYWRRDCLPDEEMLRRGYVKKTYTNAPDEWVSPETVRIHEWDIQKIIDGVVKALRKDK